MSESLGKSLYMEQCRVRKLIDGHQYEGEAMVRKLLLESEEAVEDQDAIAVLRCYNTLKEIK